MWLIKTGSIRTLCLICALAIPAFSQQKTYSWVPGNDETVRLDPGYYHTGPTYPPGPGARTIHVDINGQQPVTVAMVSAQEWSEATGRPERMSGLNLVCVQEHVIQATYTCNLPLTAPMVLLVRDERNQRGVFLGMGEVTRGRDYDRQRASDRPADSGHYGDSDRDRKDGDRDRDGRDSDRMIAGVNAVLSGRGRQFFYPNDVHMQYYDWSCTDNCNLPDPPRPKLFDWVPGESQTVRLDAADYYQGATWAFGQRDVVYHLGIDAQRPVTIAVVKADDWNNALQQQMGKNLNNIEYTCLQQHVMRSTFTCQIPVVWSPMFLVIRDERDGGHTDHDRQNPGHAVPLSQGMVVNGQDSGRRFAAPNDVRLQGYLWRCVDACDQPDFGWVSQISEKYPQTKVLKLYSATVVPDHDGEQVSVKVKSPVPMAVAMLPARLASQLYGKPDMFESAAENSTCVQRGVQNTTFQCSFNVADGPQSLVLLPEAGVDIPPKKKTEVHLQALKCVDNCGSLGAK